MKIFILFQKNDLISLYKSLSYLLGVLTSKMLGVEIGSWMALKIEIKNENIIKETSWTLWLQRQKGVNVVVIVRNVIMSSTKYWQLEEHYKINLVDQETIQEDHKKSK